MKSSRLVKLNQQRELAMPEVKRLVKKYGRTAVSWCLAQMREYEQRLNRLDEARREVARLEQSVRPEKRKARL